MRLKINYKTKYFNIRSIPKTGLNSSIAKYCLFKHIFENKFN